jgi:type I restriction enzyme S subunit
MGGYNMKLKPYPKYKDSRVQWIGKIPEGWEVKRLRFNALVNPSGKKALSNPNTLVNFLPMEKVSGNGEYEQE